MRIVPFMLIWLKILFATPFQTTAKPDKIYFNNLRFFWIFFQIPSSDSLVEIGNFIPNDVDIYL